MQIVDINIDCRQMCRLQIDMYLWIEIQIVDRYVDSIQIDMYIVDRQIDRYVNCRQISTLDRLQKYRQLALAQLWLCQVGGGQMVCWLISSSRFRLIELRHLSYLNIKTSNIASFLSLQAVQIIRQKNESHNFFGVFPCMYFPIMI